MHSATQQVTVTIQNSISADSCSVHELVTYQIMIRQQPDDRYIAIVPCWSLSCHKTYDPLRW